MWELSESEQEGLTRRSLSEGSEGLIRQNVLERDEEELLIPGSKEKQMCSWRRQRSH